MPRQVRRVPRAVYAVPAPFAGVRIDGRANRRPVPADDSAQSRRRRPVARLPFPSAVWYNMRHEY